MPSRLVGLVVVAALSAAAGCSVSSPGPEPSATEPTGRRLAVGSRVPTAAAPAAEPTEPASPPAPAVGTALAVLADLPVKGRAPRTGYDRAQFGQRWADTDRNGCDTRNDVLRRDLTDVVLDPATHGCVVLTGTLADPFSGGTLAFERGSRSADVQVDHVVAMSDAWQKGAQLWTPARRLAFANDPLNLLAVDGGLNAQKSDGDAATWLPPAKDFRCAYVARQVAVKAKYGAWVTQAEHDAIARVLSACPQEPLPGSDHPTESDLVGTAPPTPPPAVPTTAPAAPLAPVAPAAGCDPSYPDVCIAPRAQVGDLDCGDVEPRRFRVLAPDPHGFDGNHDGVGCESD